jgi:ABC-type proline/glycine betaine transport system ATPase subunit
VVSRNLQRLGTTTVYVTHDQTEAMTLGDRVAVMRAGIIQQVASPTTLKLPSWAPRCSPMCGSADRGRCHALTVTCPSEASMTVRCRGRA